MPSKSTSSMSDAEKACWAGGGVWINGTCVRVTPAKDALARGANCDPTEAAIRRTLPDPVRKARMAAMNELGAPATTKTSTNR